jgi:hypothetical protein
MKRLALIAAAYLGSAIALGILVGVAQFILA